METHPAPQTTKKGWSAVLNDQSSKKSTGLASPPKFKLESGFIGDAPTICFQTLTNNPPILISIPKDIVGIFIGFQNTPHNSALDNTGERGKITKNGDPTLFRMSGFVKTRSWGEKKTIRYFFWKFPTPV